MNDFYKKKKVGFKKFQFDFDSSKSKPTHQNFYSSKKPTSAGAFDFLELIHSWELIIGPNFSKKTIPLKHKGNVLTILTEHSSFSDQLKFLERPLIQKIEKMFPVFKGKIKSINFYSNSTFFKQKKVQIEKIISDKDKVDINKIHPQSPEYHSLIKSAREHLTGIDDPELMKRLESIFIQMKLRDKE